MRVLNISRGLLGLAFPLALWGMLAVVMACALMPAGAPRTRIVGSAFDPSTVTVALKLKPDRPRTNRPEAVTPGRKPSFPHGPAWTGYGVIQPIPAPSASAPPIPAPMAVSSAAVSRKPDAGRSTAFARAPPAG